MYYEPVRTVKGSNFQMSPSSDLYGYYCLGLAVALRGNMWEQMDLVIILNPRTKFPLPILCNLHIDETTVY